MEAEAWPKVVTIPKKILDEAFGHLQGLPMKMQSASKAMESLWWSLRHSRQALTIAKDELYTISRATRFEGDRIQAANADSAAATLNEIFRLESL